ncbi:YtxH domain-containing protein [Subtercola boreus]|uniref:YtxH domain-containing protein n=1 Tax=Subtercola boreus TaxID=120213 RepID=UPI00209BD884|nr:YtxH domain-containing protein [Subtercola boreus]
MRGKLLFVVGIGAGYVLGSRAGRQRYEQIKAGADKVWQSQPVQAGVSQVQGFANQRLDAASGRIADGVRKGLGAVLRLDRSAASAEKNSARTTPGARSGASGSGTGSGTVVPPLTGFVE